MSKPNGRVAPRALPGPPTSSVMVIIRSLLPERLAEDIIAERIRFRLGDTIVALPALAIEDNEKWTELLNDRFGNILSGLENQANAASVLTFLSGMTSTQMELLRAYDKSEQLPTDDWIRKHATSTQLVKALLAVMAAAFPLADLTFRAVLESPDLQTAMRSGFSTFMNTPQPNGAGLPGKSAAS